MSQRFARPDRARCGGSWIRGARFACVGFYVVIVPALRFHFLGFRLARRVS